MFLQMNAENSIEKTEKAITELAIRMESLQAEIDAFLKHCETLPNPPPNSFTENDLKLLGDLLQEHTSKLERTKKQSVTETKKRQAERNVPNHWLFCR